MAVTYEWIVERVFAGDVVDTDAWNTAADALGAIAVSTLEPGERWHFDCTRNTGDANGPVPKRLHDELAQAQARVNWKGGM